MARIKIQFSRRYQQYSYSEMKFLIFLPLLFVLSESGHISHGEKATSYQNIHFEHFHAVPTYIKKEDKHLLEHPVSKGRTSAKVQVHHGDKHDHGYAIASVHHDAHGHDEGHHEDISIGHHHIPQYYSHETQAHESEGGEAEADQAIHGGGGGGYNVDVAHYQQLAASAALAAGDHHQDYQQQQQYH